MKSRGKKVLSIENSFIAKQLGLAGKIPLITEDINKAIRKSGILKKRNKAK